MEHNKKTAVLDRAPEIAAHTADKRSLASAITMVCNMLERDGKPVRTEAAEALRLAYETSLPGASLHAHPVTADQLAGGSVADDPVFMGLLYSYRNLREKDAKQIRLDLIAHIDSRAALAKPVADGELSPEKLNEIARAYFSEQWAQQHCRDAIHDAFQAAQQCADSRPAGGVSYGYTARAKDGHETFFKGDARESVFHTAPWADAGMQVVPLYTHPAATLAASASVAPAAPDYFNGFDIAKLPQILISCVAKLWPGSNGLFWDLALEKMPERIEQLSASVAQPGAPVAAAVPEDARDAAYYRWLLDNPDQVTYGDFFDRTSLGPLATVSDAIAAQIAATKGGA